MSSPFVVPPLGGIANVFRLKLQTERRLAFRQCSGANGSLRITGIDRLGHVQSARQSWANIVAYVFALMLGLLLGLGQIGSGTNAAAQEDKPRKQLPDSPMTIQVVETCQNEKDQILNDDAFNIPPEIVQQVKRLAAAELQKPWQRKDRRPAGLGDLETPEQIQYAIDLAIEDLGRLNNARDDQESDPRPRLEYLGEFAFSSLVKALKSNNETVVYHACHLLGRHGQPAVAPLVDVLQNHASKQVRASAASGLGQTYHPSVVQPLIAALDDQEESVRIASCGSLGYLRDSRALEPLKKCFDDPNGHVARGAVESIQQHYSEGVVFWPVDLLNVRSLTIEAAGLKGESFGEKETAVLMRHIDSERGEVRSACLFALLKLRHMDAVPTIIELPPGRARVHALAAMPTPLAIESILRDLRAPVTSLDPSKQDAGNQLVHGVAFEKDTVISGLTNAGRWAAPLLIALLDDPELHRESWKDESLRTEWPESHGAHSYLCTFFANHGLPCEFRNLDEYETHDVPKEMASLKVWWAKYGRDFLLGEEVPNPNLTQIWYVDP